MATPQQRNRFYEFGPFRINSVERILLRGGEVVPLTPKQFDILLVLVESRGHVVEKDRLIEEVWPDTAVEEGNLTTNISMLRKALAEGASGRQYIQTLPRRGYRFVGQVSEVSEDGADLIVQEQIKSHVIIEQEENGRGDRLYFPAWPRPPISASAFKALASLALLAVTAAFVSIWIWNRPKPIATDWAVKTIAVLPFKPLVADSRNESLEMGIADTLIFKLSSIRGIIVRPISAVRKYADLNQDPLAAGREQQVEAVLDSSIQMLGEKIRVTARLVRVEDGAVLWKEMCDQQCSDLFAVQDSIAGKLAGSLALRLTDEEKQRLTRRYTDNSEAYQLYLLGRFFWNKRTPEGFKKGIEYFQQAIDKDPSYALAYSGLADCYNLLGSFGILPSNESYPKARAAAEKALEIDESLAEAHTSLARVKSVNGDWTGAEAEFKRAIELNPNYEFAHHWYAMHLAGMGRLDEAMAGMRRALEIDPLSLPSNTQVGRVFWLAGQYDEAIAQYKKVLEMEPNFAIAHWHLGWAYEDKRMYEEAIAEYQRTIDLGGRPTIVAEIGRAYGLWGKRREALKALEELKQMSKKGYVPAYDFALIYAGLGEKEQAIDWLEKMYESGGHGGLKMNRKWDSLRSHPRFQALLRRSEMRGGPR